MLPSSPELSLVELSAADVPWPLLLSADPCRDQIARYLPQSRVLALADAGVVRGVLTLTARSWGVIEITNLAVEEEWQGRGLGRRLLEAAIDSARSAGALRLDICTGNSSLAQLGLYQRMGFRIASVEHDYFSLNYPEPIIENGIHCRDRLRLDMVL
ncbi:GNAT family N-acetyltransferase [Pseudomonas sp. NY15181]|uniref:GNAT family N-acetyltransferase n=1 Tax=Pseudomonas sp. NY15181 TaxID=3400349 RepID=UPI003A8B2C75